MNFKTGIGRPGVAVAIFIAFAMCLLGLIFHPVELSRQSYGLCVPSPETWNIESVLSWILNTAGIALVTTLIFLINKQFNFVRTTEPALPALFIVMTCSIPWFTQFLNTSVILCLANVLCLGLIFTAYAIRNATRQMFIIGFVAGVGSMFQYAFLPMIAVYLIWALFMKVLRVKETLAFITGILCPFWVSLGFGWVRFSDFHFPGLTPLYSQATDHSEFLLLLIAIGIAAAIGFIVTLINSIKLYAGNSQVNSMNLCVSVLGAASVVCIIIDYENMPAYVVTLFMAFSVQLANICALWNPRMPWLVTVVPSGVYVALFVLSMILK